MCEDCAKLEKKVEALKGLIIKALDGECPDFIELKNRPQINCEDAYEPFCKGTCWPYALGQFLEDASC